MKVHVGVDESSGMIHSLETTAGNVNDVSMTDKLLHGDERRVFGDAGYVGVQKRPEHQQRATSWLISQRIGKQRQLKAGSGQQQLEKLKASVRAKVEHVFFYMKRMFGYTKVRYRGLAKNTNRLYMLAGLTNLVRSYKYLPQTQG